MLATLFEWNATDTASVFGVAKSVFPDFTPLLTGMIFPIVIAVAIFMVLINVLASISVRREMKELKDKYNIK
jgi:hypothetical protein